MTFSSKISASNLQLISWVEKGNMKDHQYLKERLENRMEWKNYYEGLMRMWIIQISSNLIKNLFFYILNCYFTGVPFLNCPENFDPSG